MPQTQLYTKKAYIAMIPETTVDTYLVPANTDIFLAELNDELFTLDGPNYEPSEARPDFLLTDENVGPIRPTVGFRVRLKGAATAGTAPEYRHALLASGLRESIVAATSVTYYPFSTFDGATAAGPPATENPSQSYSLVIWEAGQLYKFKGGFCNVQFTGNVGAGEPGFANFTYFGAYEGAAATAALSPSYDAVGAPAFKGGAFSVNYGGSHTPIGVTNFTLDLGNKVGVRSDLNGTEGVQGARIMGRKSIGTFDPEFEGTFDWLGKQRSDTVLTAMTTGVIGSTAGNKYQIKVNRCKLRPPSMVKKAAEGGDGIRGAEFTYAVSSNYTDVEGTNLDIELVFT